MCTYNISINDALMERVRSAFANNAEISIWMQAQIENQLLKMAADMDKMPPKVRLSQRLRGIGANAPKDFDYKKELETRY